MDAGIDNASKTAKGFMRFVPHAARVLMGLAFFIFGLNGFLNFMGVPIYPGGH